MNQLFTVLGYVFLAMAALYFIDPDPTNDTLAVFFFVLGLLFIFLD